MGTDGGRAHPYQHVINVDDRLVDFLEFKHVRESIFLIDNGLHRDLFVITAQLAISTVPPT